MQQKYAVIFSPIMVQYNSEFCKELIKLLNSLNYKVKVYNSLKFINKAKAFKKLVDIWNNYIHENDNIPHLAIGQAFGGSLLMGLLAKVYKNIQKAVLISAPTTVNKRLHEALDHIINTYNNEGPIQGSNMLEKLVLPINRSSNSCVLKTAPAPEGIYKTIHAYKMLQTVDLSDIVRNSAIPLLSLYGTCSQLVNTDNIILSDKYTKQLSVGVSGCGMRPIKENPELSLKLIRNFINDN